MKVIIAEKPSVAMDIAKIVGSKNRKDGYIEGNDYMVTWAFGHLVGLALPNEYGGLSFKKESLPILPDTFKLIPRQKKQGKEWKADPGVVKQLKVIESLFKKCTEIIVATDAGREGELIFRYIYNYLNCKKPFRRLWISSLTDKAIKEGLSNLRNGTEYDNLFLSAKARSEADWLIGINASQALSISAGKGSWSLGRVQTPTLSMICNRYMENKNFIPEKYFQLKASFVKDGHSFTALSTNKYASLEEVQNNCNQISVNGKAQIISVEKKIVNQEPPLLYDLTALQKDANSRYCFSAEKTLSIAQKLYEAKLISYPRTGSRYISEDVFDEISFLISQLHNNPTFCEYAFSLSTIPLNRRSVNDKKVTDHHALLITENIPGSLPQEDQLIYQMIASRMLESFSPKCIKEQTSCLLEINSNTFKVNGTIITSPGWRMVLNMKEEDQEEESKTLPVLLEKEILNLSKCETLSKQTTPRPIHTESTLLAAMENAGKEVEDEKEREAMKEGGIGTPATRAAIIETLFSREYIKREKKSLVPTDKGLAVYNIIKDKKIGDVAMTGNWESALLKIGEGQMDAITFHKGIEVYTRQITTELLNVKIAFTDSSKSYPKTTKRKFKKK